MGQSQNDADCKVYTRVSEKPLQGLGFVKIFLFVLFHIHSRILKLFPVIKPQQILTLVKCLYYKNYADLIEL